VKPYLPMAPALVREPFHRPGWVYEEKVDGYRMLAYKGAARVRQVSRNGVDHGDIYADRQGEQVDRRAHHALRGKCGTRQ
jgi:ATP-dependent DNA ligase